MADFFIDKAALHMLQSIVGIGVNDAYACLKHSNNDLNKAADYYLSGDLAKEKEGNVWDESAWNTPREGVGSNSNASGHRFSNNSQYHIQGTDVLGAGLFNGGKSRPPSRTSIKPEESDDDLAKALAQSMQGVPQPSEFGPQEVGTTGANTSSVSASFGPALPDKKYDPSSWALTTTKAEEVLLDPEPRDRRRIPGNPALLRSSSYGDNLGAVLTILHSIPLARQALFACWHTPLNQGYGEHWWKTGQNQLTRRIVRADDDEIAGRILEETQRCMAFLDKTDRAYGCADGLADMARNLATVQHNGDTAYFLNAWCAAVLATHEEPWRVTDIFTSAATQEKDGDVLTTRFQVVDLDSTRYLDPTLYSAFDGLLWADNDANAWVDFAHVICIDWVQKDPDIDIPINFYPDKYTKPWVEIVHGLRQGLREKETYMHDLESRIQRLQKFRPKSSGSDYDPKLLLEIAMGHFTTPRSQYTDNSSEIVMSGHDPVRDLQSISDQLEKKLNGLSSLQREVQASLRKLRRAYTSPEESDRPLTKYGLCGIVTESPDAYLRTSMAWWHFSWSRTSPSSGWSDTPHAVLEVKNVSEDQVLVAAKDANERLLLVYADENALEVVADELSPKKLQEFVDRDNAAFHAELGLDLSPGKKRHVGWLEDSEDKTGDSKGRGSSKGSSNGSTITLDAGSPLGNSDDTTEIIRDTEDAEIISQTVELPARSEMVERGHVSPVAKAFHLESIEKAAGLQDDDMQDVEHIERAAEVRKR